MTQFEAGDEVVFRQKAMGNGFADQRDDRILVEDGKAYSVHRGDVQSVSKEDDEWFASVEWDDGEETFTQFSKLSSPDDVEWFDQ